MIQLCVTEQSLIASIRHVKSTVVVLGCAVRSSKLSSSPYMGCRAQKSMFYPISPMEAMPTVDMELCSAIVDQILILEMSPLVLRSC